jgi:hypothetical protein
VVEDSEGLAGSCSTIEQSFVEVLRRHSFLASLGSIKNNGSAGDRELYQIYYDGLPDVGRSMWFFARSKGNPLDATRELQAKLSAIDPELALFKASSMDDVFADTLRSHVLTGVVVSIFACFSFILALVGL